MLTFTLVCLVDLVALCHYVALKCTEHITPKFRQATAELVGNAVRLCQEQVMGCVKLLIQALVSKQSPELALDAAWALNAGLRGAARGCCCHCHCGNVSVGMWPFVKSRAESRVIVTDLQ